MGLIDKLRGEVVDIVQWTDDTRDTIVWRFPRYDNEIKSGAKLTVRESQVAVFVNEGQVADVFVPGMYSLWAENLPILSTLQGWEYGFKSPFRAEVYFVSTRQFTDEKWGTKNPIMMRDADFGMVRVRAFGAYSVKVHDAAVLLRELVGTDPEFKTEEVAGFIRESVVARVATALACSGIAVLDLAGHQNEIADTLAPVISDDLKHLGLTVPRFIIENVSLPPEVEKMLDKRTSMGVVGDLAAFARFEAASSMGVAAANPSGVAGLGVGVGAGAALGAQLATALQPTAVRVAPPEPAATAAAAAVVPPPLPGTTQWYLGIDGQQIGPLNPTEVAARVSAGTAGPDTFVWRSGLAAWTHLGDVPELQAAAPPPLPA